MKIINKTGIEINTRIINRCELCNARKAEMLNCPKCDAKEYYNKQELVITLKKEK